MKALRNAVWEVWHGYLVPLFVGLLLAVGSYGVRLYFGFRTEFQPTNLLPEPFLELMIATCIFMIAWNLAWKDILDRFPNDAGLTLVLIGITVAGVLLGFTPVLAVITVLWTIVSILVGLYTLSDYGEQFWQRYRDWMAAITTLYPVMFLGHGMSKGFYFGILCWGGALVIFSLGYLPTWLLRRKLDPTLV